MKHNYTNELELKSLLIRIKNARIENNTSHTSKTIPIETPENNIKNRTSYAKTALRKYNKRRAWHM